MTSEELYQRYVWAGAMTRNADALADLFTADGVLESPLVPPCRAYPRRLEGREQIRTAMAAYYQRSADASKTADASLTANASKTADASLTADASKTADASLTADPAASRYQVHTTADP